MSVDLSLSNIFCLCFLFLFSSFWEKKWIVENLLRDKFSSIQFFSSFVSTFYVNILNSRRKSAECPRWSSHVLIVVSRLDKIEIFFPMPRLCFIDKLFFVVFSLVNIVFLFLLVITVRVLMNVVDVNEKKTKKILSKKNH